MKRSIGITLKLKLTFEMANPSFKAYLSKFARSNSGKGNALETAAGADPESEPAPDVGSEEEVLSRTLPDYIRPGLDILIVGINPGYMSAKEGHYYAGRGNHLWKCMYEAGLFRYPVDWRSDAKLLEWGIGLTNLVSRATRGQNDLTPGDFQSGSHELRRKIYEFKPKIIVFNGRKIYEAFRGSSLLHFGLQKSMGELQVYVMPSTSPRSSLYPRREDKMPFFNGLKKLYDHVKFGHALDTDEIRFEPKKKTLEPSAQIENPN